jgi:hypothetical protein
VLIENYVTTYILASYYAGAQIVLYGSAWTRLKNNLLGTNIVWRSVAAVGGRFNVLEFSKQITIRAQDTAGNLLSNGYMYYQPVGANVAGVRAKGITSDITFDLTQQAVATVSGAATSEFVYAWDWANSSVNESTYAYFCTGTTKGAETHVVSSSRYGYDKQSSTVSLIGNGAATPTYVHSSLPTTDKVIANATAITGVTFNCTTKQWVVDVGATLSVQQMYDVYQLENNKVANLQKPDDCVVTGSLRNWVGWTGINNGTITAGAGNLQIGANTITNNGTITTIYTSSAGTSSTLQLVGVTNNGVAAVWNSSTLATELFQTNVSGSSATYTVYYPPGSAGLIKNYARELFGSNRVSGSITLAAGLNTISFTDIPDVGVTQTTQATVAGYTTLETNSKLYDYLAFKRLSEQFIKLGQLLTRAGTSIEWAAGYSGKAKATNADVLSLTGSTIFFKSSSLAGDTKYDTNILVAPATLTADTTEVLTTEIEDGNGDSSVTIQAAGVSTFEIWKIPDATAPDDYATGTLLATVGIGKYRFLSANGFKFVIRDTITNFRVVVQAEKGIYTAELFFGAAVQLAQAAEVSQINTKVDVMQIDVDAIKGTGFVKDTHSLTNIKASADLSVALSA